MKQHLVGHSDFVQGNDSLDLHVNINLDPTVHEAHVGAGVTVVDDDLAWRMHQTSSLHVPERIHGRGVDEVDTSDPDLQGRVEAVEDEAVSPAVSLR